MSIGCPSRVIRIAVLSTFAAVSAFAQGPTTIRWAGENQRMPPGRWTVLSFDTHDGALNAHLRAGSDYRDRSNSLWDTDPPWLYVRANLKLGYAGSEHIEVTSREMCARSWRVADFELRQRCTGGSQKLWLIRNGATYQIFSTGRRELFVAPVWARDWDEDGHTELLISARAPRDGVPISVTLLRVEPNRVVPLAADHPLRHSR